MGHLSHMLLGQSVDLLIFYDAVNFVMFFPFADSIISYFAHQKSEISTLDKVNTINTTHTEALVNRLLLVPCVAQWCCV